MTKSVTSLLKPQFMLIFFFNLKYYYYYLILLALSTEVLTILIFLIVLYFSIYFIMIKLNYFRTFQESRPLELSRSFQKYLEVSKILQKLPNKAISHQNWSRLRPSTTISQEHIETYCLIEHLRK